MTTNIVSPVNLCSVVKALFVDLVLLRAVASARRTFGFNNTTCRIGGRTTARPSFISNYVLDDNQDIDFGVTNLSVHCEEPGDEGGNFVRKPISRNPCKYFCMNATGTVAARTSSSKSTSFAIKALLHPYDRDRCLIPASFSP